MKPITISCVLVSFCALCGAQSYAPANWKQNWAGSSVNRKVDPAGKAVLIEGFEAAQAATRSESQDQSHYQVQNPLPVLRIVNDAKDGAGAGLVVSEGTTFGLYAASREGWKRIGFDIKPGRLANATGLRFWIRAEEAYAALPVEIGETAGASARPVNHRAMIDVAGDGQWHQVTIPFFGDTLRSTVPVNSERISRIDFVVPYHRPFRFVLDRLEFIEASAGDVPQPTVYAVTDASDRVTGLGVSGAQRTNIPELKDYEEAALAMQKLNDKRETAGQAQAAAEKAQALLRTWVDQFRAKFASQAETYSYQRAVYPRSILRCGPTRSKSTG